MSTFAKTITLGALPTYRYGIDTYDPAKLGLGKLMTQFLGGTNETNFAGPAPIAIARPMEQTTAIASAFPYAIQWQNNTAGEFDWVFLADNSTAAATRRINAYILNRRTGLFTWKGFVTVTYPVASAITIRAQRITYDLYTTGTVAVSGTAVTGTSTAWQTAKVCVGNRIGFGSTDPTQISTWYEISAIGSDTAITLSATAGTIAGGTPFVIEDLRCVQLHTNATTTNGGIFVVKGLNWDQFSSIGGTVPAATTTDNIRAAYWLKDASTITHTVGFGMGLQPMVDATTQYVYSLDTLANPIVFRTNVRAALTLTAGADTTAFSFKTGSGGVLTGAPSQLNNGRLITMAAGPHAGVDTLYFTTVSRVYAAPVAGITAGSTTWLSAGSVMTEVPPGGINTFAASAGISSIEYSGFIDRLLVLTGATQRNYVTQYRTDAGQFDRLWGINTLQIDQVAADSNTTPVPSQTGGAYTCWVEGGMAYLCVNGTTAIINRMYAVPFGADYDYVSTTNCRLVFPAMTTSGASKFINATASNKQVLGGNTAATKQLGVQTEAFKLSYRTSGISDDSGSWVDLDDSGIINSAGANSIQLSATFRTIGTLSMIPARLLNVTVTYQATDMSDNWQGSSNVGTNLASKQFGFRHAVAYGGTVPRLAVTLYDAETGSLLGTDDSVTQGWTWEKSTNGGSTWGAYTTADRANANTYARITPVSLADNIKVRAVLTEY